MQNNDIMLAGISELREDGLKLVPENEPAAEQSGISKPDECLKVVPENEPTAEQSGISKPDECSKVVPENEPTAEQSGISKPDECSKVVPEGGDSKKMWNTWSPAALKTKVSDTLRNKKDSPSWLQRRRPKSSVHDTLLESKLELVEILKKNAESEAKIKRLILEEQLKQEKIKTETLQLQLKDAQRKMTM